MSTALFDTLLIQATWETFAMVFVASVIGLSLGGALGIVLFLTQKEQLLSRPILNTTLSLLVNVARSVPFIIFLIAIVPLTKLLVGSTIGLAAAIVPLGLAAIPFYARIAETAFSEVSPGLIEAALSMGASHWQIVTKVLLPEALPGLIQGGTLTVIALIGYSAMAGAVGGGGLGELAIEYGYQRFDMTMMVVTVLTLIVMVQLIQWYGDYLSRIRKLWSLSLFSLLAFLVISIHFMPAPTLAADKTLTIGITGGPQQAIMQVAAVEAKQRYDLTLKTLVFSDYVLPNRAVANGDIDANIFQHLPYLNAQKKLHHYPINAIAKTFIYPLGFYSDKIKKLSALKPGDWVVIPNDPSNEGRALLLLQQCQIIRLSDQAGLLATPQDIIRNPYQLRFKTIDAAQVPRVLGSVALAGITNDYLSVTGKTPQQALCQENAKSPYANIIVVHNRDRDKVLLDKLIKVMHSEPVIKATHRAFPHGGAIPAW